MTLHLGHGMRSVARICNILQISDPLSLLSYLLSLYLFNVPTRISRSLTYHVLSLHQHLLLSLFVSLFSLYPTIPNFEQSLANILHSLCLSGLQYSDRAKGQPWMISISDICVSIWSITNMAGGKSHRRTLKINLIWVLNFAHRHVSSHLTNPPSILLLLFHTFSTLFKPTYVASYFPCHLLQRTQKSLVTLSINFLYEATEVLPYLRFSHSSSKPLLPSWGLRLFLWILLNLLSLLDPFISI